MAEREINEKEGEDMWLQEVTSRYKYSIWSRKVTEDAFGIVSIYRVPQFLKDLKQEAYLPRVVSLGLLHHQPTNPLSQMDRRKVDAVLRMRQKLPDRNKNLLAHILKDIVSEIRKCYDEEVEANDESVTWACLLDGCFILEILDLLTRPDEKAEDSIYNKNRNRYCQFDVLRDFLIMENQIPIVVLVKILELQMENLQHAKEWLYRRLRQVSRVVHPFLPNGPLQRKKGKLQDVEDDIEDLELQKPRHMLELFHSFVTEKPSFNKKDGSHKAQRQKQKAKHKEKDYLNKFINASASDLLEAGLKFKAYYGIPCRKNLRFNIDKKTIFLPAVFITETSEMILRNLMAMEVCRPENHKQLSSYVLLVNTLVKGENDVALLRRAGIIQSSMGTDQDVMNVLNGLRKRLDLQDDSEDLFVAIKLQVNEWYTNWDKYRFDDYQSKRARKNRAFVKKLWKKLWKW